MISIKLDKREAERMFQHVRSNIPALVEALPGAIAGDLFEIVTSAAPRDIPGYPRFLQLYRVPTTSGWSGAAILAKPWAYSQRMGKQETGVYVLKVVPRMKGEEPASAAAMLLSEYNPWTVATLPWMPPKSLASVRSARVSAVEVQEVERERLGDLAEVRRELRELGVTELRKKGSVSLGRRTSRDLVAEVVRAEFGIGRPGRKHWRLAADHLNAVVKHRVREAFAWIVSSRSVYTDQGTMPTATRGQMDRARKFQAAILGER